jgi:hypothetical protein
MRSLTSFATPGYHLPFLSKVGESCSFHPLFSHKRPILATQPLTPKWTSLDPLRVMARGILRRYRRCVPQGWQGRGKRSTAREARRERHVCRRLVVNLNTWIISSAFFSAFSNMEVSRRPSRAAALQPPCARPLRHAIAASGQRHPWTSVGSLLKQQLHNRLAPVQRGQY